MPSSTPKPAPGSSQTFVPEMAPADTPRVGAASMKPASAAMPRIVPPNSAINWPAMLPTTSTLPLMLGAFGLKDGFQPESSLFALSSKSIFKIDPLGTSMSTPVVILNPSVVFPIPAARFNFNYGFGQLPATGRLAQEHRETYCEAHIENAINGQADVGRRHRPNCV